MNAVMVTDHGCQDCGDCPPSCLRDEAEHTCYATDIATGTGAHPADYAALPLPDGWTYTRDEAGQWVAREAIA